MQAVAYYLSLPLLYGISLLPFPVLYFVSDLLYVLVYHVVGYRKPVVRRNLERSFPDKSADELQRLTRRFYRYFCDLTLETLKTLTIRPTVLKKRVRFNDLSAIEECYRQGRSVVLVMGHFGNWELAGARFALEPIHPLYVIYHPLKNPYFDRLFIRMRTRLGNRLYPMKEAVRSIMRDRDAVTATAFIADQNPSARNVYWTRFLNQDTAVFMGSEKIARKLNTPVIYVSVKRKRRGVYCVDTDLLVSNPADTQEHEISERQTRRLEQDIIAQPETWLWTHRRWKQQRKMENRNHAAG